MECPSCGALTEIGIDQCLECDALTMPMHDQNGQCSPSSLHETLNEAVLAEDLALDEPPLESSRLIEFPGVSRNAVPEWRKELSERVREVHEKRAREAAFEGVEEQVPENGNGNSVSQLELLPQAEAAPLNPLVAAALRRIERANHSVADGADYEYGANAVAALAHSVPADQNGSYSGPTLDVDGTSEEQVSFNLEDNSSATEPPQPEKSHNLVVVPPRITDAGNMETKSKPRRMIADNDPSLNYLDSVPTSLRVEVESYCKASVFSRFLGALVDLVVAALLCAPYAALVELTERDWQDWRVVVVGVGIFAIVSFVYLTISTALTGQTLGTRLLSLRIVDARTGLIPTGSQSAGRALIYLATLLTLGLASLTLMGSDRLTPHDRLTHTTVISV